MSNNYPIFCAPQWFMTLNDKLPPLPQKPTIPKEPKLIKKNFIEKLFLWCDEEEDREINQRRLDKYRQELEVYNKAVIEYKVKVAEILSESNIQDFRNGHKVKLLNITLKASDLSRDVQKGRYELLFKTDLIETFGNMIFDNMEMNGNNQFYSYVPDFVYLDRQTGLSIDIEIDEPYSLPSKIPIHYIGADDYRNKSFTQNGWFVIRFAEIQVALYPKKCVEYIKNVIHHILYGVDISPFNHPIPQWEMTEAYNMAKCNFREQYNKL